MHAHDDTTLSGEKGYVREAGNLVFHVALIGILVGVAWGHLLGWRGDVIVPEGETLANTLSRYDTFSPGPWVDVNDLEPWTLALERLDVSSRRETKGRGQFGAPRDFEATTTFTPRRRSSEQRAVRVNGPLETGDGTVFLLGNGYAPDHGARRAGHRAVLRADDFPPAGRQLHLGRRGEGAGRGPEELGFAGFFLPTGVIDDEQGPHSVFPDTLDPQLALTAFEGELFPTAGRSRCTRSTPRR